LAAAGAFAEKLITIVFDCNGSLTPRERDALIKRGGVVIDSPSQIWLATPGPGAVGIVEADSLEHAERVAEGFPLAQAGLLEVEVIALARLYRLRRTSRNLGMASG
jgi:hypothetical protein